MKRITAQSICVWDGGERHNHQFYLATKEDAAKYLEIHKFDMAQEVTIDIFESFDEWVDWDSGAARRRALAKLTAEDRRALGIED